MKRRLATVAGGAIDGPWITMTPLIGGWVQSGSVVPAYMIDSRNIVHLRGSVTGVSAASAPCFVLPSGFTPAAAATAYENRYAGTGSWNGFVLSSGYIYPRPAAGAVGDVVDLSWFNFKNA